MAEAEDVGSVEKVATAAEEVPAATDEELPLAAAQVVS